MNAGHQSVPLGKRPEFAIAICVAYVSAYVTFDWLSYVAPVAPFGITPWNPPPALSIALIAWFGVRFWPALVVAAIAAEVVVRDLPAPAGFTLLNASVMALGYTSSAVLLQRILGSTVRVASRRDLIWFLAIIAAITLPIAFAYIAILTGPALLSREDVIRNVATFWVGDVIGIIVFLPLVLMLPRLRQRFWTAQWTDIAETAGQAIAIAAALALLSGEDTADQSRLFYVLFLPAIWIAVRRGSTGAVMASGAIQVGLIAVVTSTQYSPLSVLELQSLMLTLTVTALFLGVVADERREAVAALRGRDEEISRMLRMAAVSEMSSALAHELNQPLAAISNYVRAAAMIAKSSDTPDMPLLNDTLTKTVTEVDRAGRVVHRLRDFYRTGSARMERVGVDKLIEDALSPLQSRLNRNGIALEIACPKPAPDVAADAVQIATVIHNIAANAVDALATSANKPRILSVNVTQNSTEASIAISDNGPGIAEEVRGRVFDAFATTKQDGLGLGLTISKTIIESHGGRISVSSGSDGGTHFTFTLPLTGSRSTP